MTATSGTKWNRLAQEKSPYLLQHASNPVNWYPWGELAFSKAKDERKPIFLSVGYSTCHWCHVMEHESFEKDEIGKLLNDNFVSIKVDREERPDVDKIYMTFIQAISGSGGWPMSVFLTPELKPITGGTYFPPQDSPGRLGFSSILKMIASKWRENKDDICRQGEALAVEMKKMSKINESVDLPKLERVVSLCYEHLADSFDSAFGGFGKSPKFPQPVNLDFLLHFYNDNKDNEFGSNALKIVEKTLEAMDRGGIHDHLSQGFHRYSVDRHWHVPHFEKMLYDQAQLTTMICGMFQITGRDQYKDLIIDILTYVTRDLSHPNGGFYSAEDADSLPKIDSIHKKEGAFCVWTWQELKSILDEPLFGVFCRHFGIKKQGNVEPSSDPHNELSEKNVLMVVESIEKTSKSMGISIEDVKMALNEAKNQLFIARNERPRPHLDTKIITAWNGLMISGFAKASVCLNDSKLAERAEKAVEFVKTHLMSERNGLLRSVYTDESTLGGIVQIDNPIGAFADDFAYLIQGILDLYETTFDCSLIGWADQLQLLMDSRFWDDQNGGYYLSGDDDPSIFMRIKEDQDGAEPCTNSVSALNLVRLADILDHDQYRLRARRIFLAFSQRIDKFSFVLPKMITAYQRWQRPPTQVVVFGSCQNQTVHDMRIVAQNYSLPWKSIVAIDADTDHWLIDRVTHYKELCNTFKTKPTAVVCKNFTCSMPLFTADKLKTHLDVIQ